MTSSVIPNRPVFRAQEVCELADVQLYVLRTWEAEFPDLGTIRSPSGPRVYRRADVERVLRIKHLLFAEGLTLAGARRRLNEDGPGPSGEAVTDGDVAAMIDDATRQELLNVRRGLHWILGVLAGDGVTPEDRALVGQPATRRRPAASAAKKKPARSEKRDTRARKRPAAKKRK